MWGMNEMMSDLRATVTSSDSDAVDVRLNGRLDGNSAPMVMRLLDDALLVGRPVLRLDLSEVVFIDLRGLEALLQSDAKARAAGATLVLRSPSARVLDMMLLTGTDAILAVEVDLRERRAAAHQAFGVERNGN